MRFFLVALAAGSAASIQNAAFMQRDGEQTLSHPHHKGHTAIQHMISSHDMYSARSSRKRNGVQDNGHARASKHSAEFAGKSLSKRSVGDRHSARRQHSSSGIQCHPGKPGCKSVCHWLMLSENDESWRPSGSGGPPLSSCPLFESQLAMCHYVLPEKRREGAPSDPMDCAVQVLQSYVHEVDVAKAVDKLTDCLGNMPVAEKHECHDAVDALDVELEFFRAEADFRAQADVQRERLDAAVARGEEALETKEGAQAAMDAIAAVLADAERVPGHYLTDTIHGARSLLGQLGPIPLVLEELGDAQEEGRAALEAKDAYRSEQAILRLGSTMNEAEELEMDTALKPAAQLEEDLSSLASAAENLNAAIVQANSSWSTVSRMGKSLERLREAADVYRELGLTDREEEAMTVFNRLFEKKMAFVAIRASIVEGEVALSEGEGESEAVDSLEDAVSDAKKVKLHRGLPVAVDVLHALLRQEDVKANKQVGDARVAL